MRSGVKTNIYRQSRETTPLLHHSLGFASHAPYLSVDVVILYICDSLPIMLFACRYGTSGTLFVMSEVGCANKGKAVNDLTITDHVLPASAAHAKFGPDGNTHLFNTSSLIEIFKDL